MAPKAFHTASFAAVLPAEPETYNIPSCSRTCNPEIPADCAAEITPAYLSCNALILLLLFNVIVVIYFSGLQRIYRFLYFSGLSRRNVTCKCKFAILLLNYVWREIMFRLLNCLINR